MDDVEMYKSHKGPVSELHIVDRYMMEVKFIVYRFLFCVCVCVGGGGDWGGGWTVLLIFYTDIKLHQVLAKTHVK